MYRKREQNYGIGPALAGNRNSPTEILDKLLADGDLHTLRRLAENPTLSCVQLRKVQARLRDEKMGSPNTDLAKALARCDGVVD